MTLERATGIEPLVNVCAVTAYAQPQARAELLRLSQSQFYSFMSLAELRRWTLERNWGEGRRQELEE